MSPTYQQDDRSRDIYRVDYDELREKASPHGYDETPLLRPPDELNTEGTEFDIPEDAYGCAILALVKDLAKLVDGQRVILVWCRVMFPMLLLFLNLFLQFILLWYIRSLVVQPAVSRVQHSYAAFHREIFDVRGNFKAEVWENWHRKPELCQVAMTNTAFLYIVLFIWILRMITEIRICHQFYTDITSMPHCDRAIDQIVKHEHGEHIIGLTRLSRILCYVLVCIPKLAISLFLMNIGCRWLAATTSFEKLVLNTLAMEFITQIDETLFNAFVPQEYRHQVRDINFFVQNIQDLDKDEQSAQIRAFGSSVLYTSFSVGLVWIFGSFFQNVLPRDIGDISDHCWNYIREAREPVCERHTDMHKCYPFGPSNSSSSTFPITSGLARSLLNAAFLAQ